MTMRSMSMRPAWRRRGSAWRARPACAPSQGHAQPASPGGRSSTAPQATPPDREAKPRARCVLVVDDDDDVRACLAEVLGDEGYLVHTASNGREALDALRDEGLRPDVIVLDMMMPVMDGWAFRAEQLKIAELAGIPVIVFTAYGAGAVEELNAAAFLKKPLRLDALLAAVERTPTRSPADP